MALLGPSTYIYQGSEKREHLYESHYISHLFQVTKYWPIYTFCDIMCSLYPIRPWRLSSLFHTKSSNLETGLVYFAVHSTRVMFFFPNTFWQFVAYVQNPSALLFQKIISLFSLLSVCEPSHLSVKVFFFSFSCCWYIFLSYSIISFGNFLWEVGIQEYVILTIGPNVLDLKKFNLIIFSISPDLSGGTQLICY